MPPAEARLKPAHPELQIVSVMTGVPGAVAPPKVVFVPVIAAPAFAVNIMATRSAIEPTRTVAIAADLTSSPVHSRFEALDMRDIGLSFQCLRS